MAQLARREHIRKLERICSSHGATMELVRENGKHVVFNIDHFGSVSRFIVPSTASDHRAGKNSEAMLRRILKHGPPPTAVMPASSGGNDGNEEPEARPTAVAVTRASRGPVDRDEGGSRSPLPHQESRREPPDILGPEGEPTHGVGRGEGTQPTRGSDHDGCSDASDTSSAASSVFTAPVDPGGGHRPSETADRDSGGAVQIPGMTDIARLVAAQIETQVDALVRGTPRRDHRRA